MKPLAGLSFKKINELFVDTTTTEFRHLEHTLRSKNLHTREEIYFLAKCAAIGTAYSSIEIDPNKTYIDTSFETTETIRITGGCKKNEEEALRLFQAPLFKDIPEVLREIDKLKYAEHVNNLQANWEKYQTRIKQKMDDNLVALKMSNSVPAGYKHCFVRDKNDPSKKYTLIKTYETNFYLSKKADQLVEQYNAAQDMLNALSTPADNSDSPNKDRLLTCYALHKGDPGNSIRQDSVHGGTEHMSFADQIFSKLAKIIQSWMKKEFSLFKSTGEKALEKGEDILNDTDIPVVSGANNIG